MDDQTIMDKVNTWESEESPYSAEVRAQWTAEFVASCQAETE